ncbi:NTP transferase domain-containing protein [Neolewinella lacunae]|uniref:NTP transferase domain-containing protein n=1 Tax=Neolewinella lacunae TaxID=1517758 RepID=A0A923PF58_9BACT|nr:NTP transferase domain-containing protein [Neolewinella lacunae]MBC6992955.1 NTP transferase domain-containing protein [Neolewinella lacunae]MDN3633867.1 NTP transferase domain-containing protein [Neolewinella lacunae]
MPSDHQKHPPLARPTQGYYARTEFSLVGTTCARIDGLLHSWLPRLGEDFRTLTITGDHAEQLPGQLFQSAAKQFRASSAPWNEYDDRLLGGHYDLVLTNGNHYPAARQIAFIDPAKAGTLERRREQLTDLAAIVFIEPAASTLPAWLTEHLASLAQTPVLISLADDPTAESLFTLVHTSASARRPPLKAVVLAGGKSTRMGTDKASLVYHNGQTESARMVDMCRSLGLETFLSVATTEHPPVADVPLIPDRFLGMGVVGAICSALLTDPDAAWLVLACDLPLLDAPTLRELVATRDARQYATAVKGASQPFPEPLIAIYEPRAYARLLQFLALGYACPRKLLINSEIALLELSDEAPLTNANRPEDRERILGR